MPFARRTPLAAAPLVRLAALATWLAAVPAPAAAQPGFEGVITMRMRVAEAPEPMTMRYLVRQGVMRNEMNMNGMQAVSIVDPARREIYTVMPAQRMYMVMPMPDPSAATGAGGKPAEVTRTGRRETVAGHACEHYLIRTEGETVDACLATDMPPMAAAGGRGGRGAGSPAWARALGAQAGFPLKVTTADGGSVLEVTSIERKTLDPALFAPPADFRRMQMPAGIPRP